jgi:hypothetical protein
MDNEFIKNSAVNKSENCVRNSDNYNPKQKDICNSNQVTSTAIPLHIKFGEKLSTQNSSYQIFNNLIVVNRF